MNEILESISVIIKESIWLAPLLALVAGMLTSVTPCSLSTIPLVIGVVGGTGQTETKKAFKLSLIFALGTAITFTLLGTIASLAGNLIGTSAKWWYIALGIFAMAVVLCNFVGNLVQTTPMDVKQWIVVLVTAFMVVPVDWIRKAICKKGSN